MSIPVTNLNDTISSLVSTGLKPIIVQGILLRLVSALFSRRENIINPQIRDYVWDPDKRVTKIQIMPLFEWNRDTIQQRPAIVVKRNAWTTRKMAIGDGRGTAFNWNTSNTENLPLGNPVMQMGIEGSSTLFIIAGEAAECELLATEVYSQLIQYSAIIIEEFGFYRFAVSEVGPIARLDESAEHFVVPINVAYALMEEWQLIQESPLFKSLIVTENL